MAACRPRLPSHAAACLSLLAWSVLAGCETKTERIIIPEGPTNLSWTSQHPRPLGSRSFLSVFGTSPNSVFAVGAEGAIAHFDGDRWSLMNSETFFDLRDVWASSDSNAFAVGGWYFSHYDGARWRTQMNRLSLEALWGFSALDVWATGYSDVFRYNGSTWSAFGLSSDSNYSINDIWGTAPDNVFAAGWRDVLHYDGSEWREIEHGITNAGFRQVGGSGANDVWVAGGNDTMLHYDGAEWKLLVSPVHYYSSIAGISGSTADDMYLGFSSDYYSSSVWRYDGSTFTDITDYDVVREVNDIWAADGTVVCVGSCGAIVTFDGTSWSDAQGGPHADLHDVWSDGTANAWAVGDNGTILHFDGAVWTNLRHPALEPNGLQAVAGTASSLYAVGYLGTVLHYDGITVRDISNIVVTSSKLCDVWAIGDEAFAVGYGGAIVHIVGNNVTAMSSHTSRYLLGVWGSAADDVFAVGQRGTILHYDGTEWSAMATPDTLSELRGIWGSAHDNVYVCGTNNLMRYDGSSWSIVAFKDYGDFEGIWGSSASDVYVIAGNRFILHYDGIKWVASRIIGVTSSRLHAISGSASDNIFAVGQRGAILHYGP